MDRKAEDYSICEQLEMLHRTTKRCHKDSVTTIQRLLTCITELEAESSKHYDFWQKHRIHNEALNKRIAELEAEKDRHQRTHEIVCKDYEAMEHTIRQHEATLQRVGELLNSYFTGSAHGYAVLTKMQAELEGSDE